MQNRTIKNSRNDQRGNTICTMSNGKTVETLEGNLNISIARKIRSIRSVKSNRSLHMLGSIEKTLLRMSLPESDYTWQNFRWSLSNSELSLSHTWWTDMNKIDLVVMIPVSNWVASIQSSGEFIFQLPVTNSNQKTNLQILTRK